MKRLHDTGVPLQLDCAVMSVVSTMAFVVDDGCCVVESAVSPPQALVTANIATPTKRLFNMDVLVCAPRREGPAGVLSIECGVVNHLQAVSDSNPACCD